MSELKYIVTEHTKKRLKKRNIDISELMDCLKRPDQITLGKKGRLIYQKKLPLNGKRKLLRVVVIRNKDLVKAISIYKTSKFDKYWKKEGENES